MPYIKGTSEIIVTYVDDNIRIVYRPVLTLRHQQTNVKKKSQQNNEPSRNKQCQSKFADCQVTYEAYTGRKLNTRFTTHREMSPQHLYTPTYNTDIPTCTHKPQTSRKQPCARMTTNQIHK